MRNRFPSFVKLPQPKRFNFRTRYYDAQKEELEQRIAKAKREAEKGEISNAEHLRDRLSDTWRANSRQRANQKSNMRVALIAGILFIAFYYYFFGS